eukprot:CAMPEP_0179047864 /NCGR_PEP_ID=MMETSP0796-20121207/19416_1 /TAXON_ID=73915 /ORGANISM="Pyrodinium bahamense, Strain pbaha01" /LENGTH=247 /DNA_ID=CAMNT_0020744321 /DNA_START=47 /DNA_END=790 /DNA_ORIENTATION=-
MAASDLSEYVMVADPIECLRLAREASAIEGTAMQHDLQGEVEVAIGAYQRAVAILHDAMRACPEGHPDSKVLERHASEVSVRAGYLAGLGGQPATVPLEEHILCVQLTLGSAAPGPQGACSPTNRVVQVMGAAAAISGATGLLVLGPLGGAALGVATALATTREDQAGSVARRVGHAGIQLYCKAREMDREHRITDRVTSVSGRVVHCAVGKARMSFGQLSERHKVLGKLGQASSMLASMAWKTVAC